MKEKIKVLLLQPEHQASFELIDKDQAFQEIKRLIDCEYLEVHPVKIGDRLFYAFMDDNGLLLNKPVSVFSARYGFMVGNIALTHFESPQDEEYYTLDPTDEAIIRDKLRAVEFPNGDRVIALDDNYTL